MAYFLLVGTTVSYQKHNTSRLLTLSSIGPSMPTSKVAQQLPIRLISSGDYFPLWGTCQGFQLLSVLGAQDHSVLLHNYYDSYNYSIPIVLTPNAASSRLFNALSPSTVKTLTTKNCTENLHHNGVLPETYTKNANLAAMFKLLSVNMDRKGTPFGSTMEGRVCSLSCNIKKFRNSLSMLLSGILKETNSTGDLKKALTSLQKP